MRYDRQVFVCLMDKDRDKQVVGDYMNRRWLLENADVPIRYILTKDANYLDTLLENHEVQYWLSHLKKRSDENNVHAIHGSHDFRMENVLGKCGSWGFPGRSPSSIGICSSSWIS